MGSVQPAAGHPEVYLPPDLFSQRVLDHRKYHRPLKHGLQLRSRTSTDHLGLLEDLGLVAFTVVVDEVRQWTLQSAADKNQKKKPNPKRLWHHLLTIFTGDTVTKIPETLIFPLVTRPLLFRLDADTKDYSVAVTRMTRECAVLLRGGLTISIFQKKWTEKESKATLMTLRMIKGI